LILWQNAKSPSIESRRRKGGEKKGFGKESTELNGGATVFGGRDKPGSLKEFESGEKFRPYQGIFLEKLN